MRVALAQINPTVGDIEGNAAKIAEWIDRARAEGAELAIFPELCLPGYPAEDLYLKRHFVEANRRAVEELARGVNGLTVLVGFAEPVADGGDFRHAHNSLAVLAGGAVRAVYRKNRLPNYAVFDEQRYFVPGSESVTIEVAGTKVGLTICEDCWVEGPPASVEAAAGAELIANPSGSPYHRGKGAEREEMFIARARAYGAGFAFCNLVGGQDELVFDGQSFVVGPGGEILARAAQFEEELLVCDAPSPPMGRFVVLWTTNRPIGGLLRSRCLNSTRSTGRWSSVCATTFARTASATSASPSRAGSTPPWWRCSPPTRSGPST